MTSALRVKDALFHARARVFPWTLSHKVRTWLGLAAMCWALVNCMMFYALLGIESAQAQAARGLPPVDLRWPMLYASLAFNGALGVVGVWQIPLKACKHCGRTRKDPVEGADHR